MEIGRFSFSDSGPPFHVYELFIVSPDPQGSSIQRMSMTEPVSMCAAPLKYGIVSKTITKTPVELFGKTNPCKVPDKVPLESDHCTVCPVYSAGTEISAQVRCGSQTRIIRRFFPNGIAESKPPRRDSWMVELMHELESATGNVGRPFPIVESEEPQPNDSNLGYSRTLVQANTIYCLKAQAKSCRTCISHCSTRNWSQQFRRALNQFNRKGSYCRFILLWPEWPA